MRWAQVGDALCVSEWRWVGLDVVGLHEGSELVGDLSQGLSSLLMEEHRNDTSTQVHNIVIIILCHTNCTVPVLVYMPILFL